ncbi:hypothetical protein [Streptomyces viridosporus]|uniref:hypothetical protein n=1 Tax=Streptomyces viridosporus TaxID=67581 RepID=UPI0036F4CEDF
MTAPVTSRIPTPADIARRTSARPGPMPAPTTAHAQAAPEQQTETRPRAADAIRPGVLQAGERIRRYYVHGMRHGGLPAHARLVGHDLLWRAGDSTGRIPPKLQPTLEDISSATGLTTRQVEVALQVLRTRGWLYDRLVTVGPRTGTTAYELAIPAFALERIRARLRRKPSEHALV